MSERNLHYQFIDNLIKEPIETYKKLRAEFNSPATTFGQFEELWPVVNFLLSEINSEHILDVCLKDIGLGLQRKLVLQDLRHISLQNRVITPYVETIRVIEKTLEFFDICVRFEELSVSKEDLDKFILEEENPRNRSLAYYHRYRYLYYYSWLMDKVPNVFLIPTPYDFTARDLIRFRCVPIFILGVSTKRIYVDEFEQTPIEFFMHDVNHARRQFMANLEWYKQHDIYSEEDKLKLYETAHNFTKPLLDKLEISPEDTEEQKAFKNLKIMILFEVAHEDADLLLPETIAKSLQRKEGFKSHFEVPVIDMENGAMDIKDTIETGITTLAYVRHKLQRSFYAKAGSSNHAVDPKYCTTKHIARAAYELLKEIGIKADDGVPADKDGYVTEEWLLERACSFGPEIVHNSEVEDVDLENLSTEIKEVNIKEYFDLDKSVQQKTEQALSDIVVDRPPMAEIKYVVDCLLFVRDGKYTKVLLTKRQFPPQAGSYALPGGFLWQNETGQTSATRILKTKTGVEGVNLKQLATFDSPIRDPRGHVVSTIYYGLIDHESLPASIDEEMLFDVNKLPDLAFDHKKIINFGLAKIAK